MRIKSKRKMVLEDRRSGLKNIGLLKAFRAV